jgi:hypothetical protein
MKNEKRIPEYIIKHGDCAGLSRSGFDGFPNERVGAYYV